MPWMLFNLLVAMMGSTYEEVKEKADHRWKLERARIIASLESEMQLHEFEATALSGRRVEFSCFAGKPVLFVNVASE